MMVMVCQKKCTRILLLMAYLESYNIKLTDKGRGVHIFRLHHPGRDSSIQRIASEVSAKIN